MNTLKISLCQTDILWENPSDNIGRYDLTVREYCRQVGKHDIMVFPEFFTTGFTMDRSLAEDDKGISVSWLRNISKELGISVVTSVPTLSEGGKRVNRCYFITDSGEEYHYDKRHLFNVAAEGDTYSPGNEQVIVPFKGWKIALSVCYDLRFPVWSRNRENGYDLMINIANWPSSRIDAAQILVKARSIENVCYYLFCNRVGSDTSCDYNGHSLIVDSRGIDVGSTINVAGTDFIYGEIDIEPLLIFRERFPAWKDSDNFIIEK